MDGPEDDHRGSDKQGARTLLLTTDLPVQAVCEAVGFGDAFHFTRQSTATVGCSLRAFR